VALPEHCEVVDGALVFYELAQPDVLADADRLYEYTCFTACTNLLRPLGVPTVSTQALPELAPGEVTMWGGRALGAEAADTYRQQGFVLAELRLPVAPMGPSATQRPASAGG
jgi:hypothetical protein